MKSLFTNLLILLTFTAWGQTELVLNGGVINISKGAALVLENPANTAIIRMRSGYIISEGENNRIIWSVGTGNSFSYTVPFGNASNYLPLSFSAASGSPNGRIIFSTYPTPTWKNSDYLPSGVTNVNHDGVDNSIQVIDLFWQLAQELSKLVKSQQAMIENLQKQLAVLEAKK